MRNNSTSAEMPIYYNDKDEKVWALKIGEVMETVRGGVIIFPINEKFAPIEVNKNFAKEFNLIRNGGYYVVSKGNTKSFILNKVFESNYYGEEETQKTKQYKKYANMNLGRFVGYYKVGEKKINFKKKPHFIHILFAKLLLGWEWKNLNKNHDKRSN